MKILIKCRTSYVVRTLKDIAEKIVIPLINRRNVYVWNHMFIVSIGNVNELYRYSVIDLTKWFKRHS